MAWEKSASGVGPKKEGQEVRIRWSFCFLFLVFMAAEKGGKLAQKATWLVVMFAEAAAQSLEEPWCGTVGNGEALVVMPQNRECLGNAVITVRWTEEGMCLCTLSSQCAAYCFLKNNHHPSTHSPLSWHLPLKELWGSWSHTAPYGNTERASDTGEAACSKCLRQRKHLNMDFSYLARGQNKGSLRTPSPSPPIRKSSTSFPCFIYEWKKSNWICVSQNI